MKNLLILYLCFAYSTLFAQTFEWAQKAGGVSSDVAYGVCNDTDGNAYITGQFTGSATFGTLVVNGKGGTDIFIAKYSENGNILWAKSAGGEGSDLASGIAADAFGNIYITGYFSGKASFDHIELTASAGTDAFIAKYSSSGEVQWAVRAGGSGSASAMAIAATPSGDVAVAGKFRNTINIEGESFTSSGSTDVFIAVYNTSGSLVWARHGTSGGEAMATGVTFDKDGNVVATGFFYGTIDFSSSSLVAAAASADVFIVKYRPDGSFSWAKKVGGDHDDSAYGITADAEGNILVTGYFLESASFGDISLTGAGYNDVFLAKLNPLGEILWAKRAGGLKLDVGIAVVTDEFLNIYLTGIFDSHAAFGTLQLTGNSYDIFIAKYNSAGNVLWVKKAGDLNSDLVKAISIDNKGNVFIAGYYYFFNSFDDIKLPSSSDSDIFIAKLIQPTSSIFGLKNRSFEIYPNPASNYLFISVPHEVVSAEFILKDLSGRAVFRIDIGGPETHHRIQLPDNLSKGYYTGLLKSGSSTWYSKIIIQ